MGSRSCADCGSSRRMVDQPEGETLCGYCLHGDPRDRSAAQAGKPRFTLLKGVYNDEKAIAEMHLQPGQGRGKS